MELPAVAVAALALAEAAVTAAESGRWIELEDGNAPLHPCRGGLAPRRCVGLAHGEFVMAVPCPLILCKSVHHGNTAKIAAVMADVLHAEIADPEAVSCPSLLGRPLVGFGSGVYYGRMHQALSDRLHALPDAPEARTPAFVFSTAGLPWLAWFWHRALRGLLARKGFRVAGDFSCGGYDTWGPLWLGGGLNRTHPDEHDLERARCFARWIDATVPGRTGSQPRSAAAECS